MKKKVVNVSLPDIKQKHYKSFTNYYETFFQLHQAFDLVLENEDFKIAKMLAEDGLEDRVRTLLDIYENIERFKAFLGPELFKMRRIVKQIDEEKGGK